MRYSTTLVVAALSVGQSLAGPTHGHVHRHRDVHVKKDVDWKALDWENMGINWSEAWEKGQHKSTAAPTPAPVATSAAPVVVAAPAKTTAAAAKPVATTSSDSTSNTATTPFSNIKGIADGFTSFGSRTAASGAVVGKIGNIGSPQCSNMMKVSAVGDYSYTNEFINTSGKPMTIAVWNKAFQRDGVTDANLGSCVAPVTPCLSITLAAGASQIVAFDEDTQAGWAQATSDIAISGAYATTWAEVNYQSGGQGFDVSAIMNKYGNTYDMHMSSAQNDCISDRTQNLWIGRNNNPEDPIPVGNSDGSCYVPDSKMNLVTKMGGSTA